PGAVITEFMELIYAVLAGKHGPVTTLAVDGIHNLYGYFHQRGMAKVRAAIPNLAEDKVGLQAYMYSHPEFTGDFIKPVSESPLSHFVMTAWAQRERDDPDNQSRNAPMSLLPDLPGVMSRNILGLVGVSLYAEPGQVLGG